MNLDPPMIRLFSLCDGWGLVRARFAGEHPQGVLSQGAVSRKARSGQRRCPERAVGDAHRLERSFRDIGYVPNAPFVTMPGAARPARAAGFAAAPT
jgi:hypothetical protein